MCDRKRGDKFLKVLELSEKKGELHYQKRINV
jgi:hypothetical protein